MLTGTIDAIEGDIETGKVILHDWKTTKVYAGKMVKRERDHGYRQQLNLYAFILFNDKEKFKDIEYDDIELYLHMFYKDANLLEGEDTYEKINVLLEIMDNTSQSIARKLEKLQNYLDNDIMPDECSNAEKWWRITRKNKTKVPSRCKLYCNVNHICPYYDPGKPEAKHKQIDWLK
jgi:hypothetical protein